MVEQPFDPVRCSPGKIFQAHFLRQILPDQSVRILVAAALPGFVWLLVLIFRLCHPGSAFSLVIILVTDMQA